MEGIARGAGKLESRQCIPSPSAQRSAECLPCGPGAGNTAVNGISDLMGQSEDRCYKTDVLRDCDSRHTYTWAPEGKKTFKLGGRRGETKMTPNRESMETSQKGEMFGQSKELSKWGWAE